MGKQSEAGGENNGWFANLWEQTQHNTQTTIKFFEEEHKKNVQKFEAAIDEIKTVTEEVADGIQSQLEGRKSLKALREERVRDAARHASSIHFQQMFLAKKEGLTFFFPSTTGGKRRGEGGA
jgi:hypothetical protein